MGNNGECYVLKWNEFHSSVANSFTNLRNADEFLDVTVAIDEDHMVQAHKVILSASSPYFHSMLKRNPAQHPVLVMPPHIRYVDLMAIVDFVYEGEVKVPMNDFADFVSLAQMLKIRGLTEDMTDTAAKKNPTTTAKVQPGRLPPGTQMVRRRSAGPVQPSGGAAAPNQKRPRVSSPMSSPMASQTPPPPQQPSPKFNQGPVGMTAQASAKEYEGDGDDQGRLQPVEDDDTEFYGEEYDQSGYIMEQGATSSTPPSAGGLQLTGLLCPQCRMMCHGVDALKEHLAQVHNVVSATESEKKMFTCNICDKAFKTSKYVQAHIKRVHKLPEPHQDFGDETGDPLACGPQPKSRPKKSSADRPIGQVTPAPRPNHPLGVMGRGRVTSAMVKRRPAPRKARSRPPLDVQQGGVDIKRLGMKLGGQISITSSEQSSASSSSLASPNRRPVAGPSRPPKPTATSEPNFEVKEEPLDDFDEEDDGELADDYEEGEDYGEDEDEDEDGAYMAHGMYGEAPYDDEAEGHYPH